MDIVSARVHPIRDTGCERQPGPFGTGQRVHLCPQRDGWSVTRAGEMPNDAGAATIVLMGNLEPVELSDHGLRGLHLLVGQLRMLVEMTAQLNHPSKDVIGNDPVTHFSHCRPQPQPLQAEQPRELVAECVLGLVLCRAQGHDVKLSMLPERADVVEDIAPPLSSVIEEGVPDFGQNRAEVEAREVGVDEILRAVGRAGVLDDPVDQKHRRARPAPSAVALGEADREVAVRIAKDQMIERAPSDVAKRLQGGGDPLGGVCKRLIDPVRQRHPG